MSAKTLTIAQHAGFCFGVERAIDMASKAKGKVVSYGPLIHNPQVVEALKQMGIEVVFSIEEIYSGDVVIIRTHGAPREELCAIKKKTTVIDATCPFVKKVQFAAQELSEAGLPVVVVGERNHPEVKGIISYIKGEYFLVDIAEDVLCLPSRSCLGVVAQTTRNPDQYAQIIEALKAVTNKLVVKNTVCVATTQRQKEAVELADKVDTMFVVGGKNSANTTRLYELCLKKCERTYHIEKSADITEDMIFSACHVGISAGASTPKALVEEICNLLRNSIADFK